MKVEIQISGRYELALLPEDAVDELVLREMAQRAERGTPVTIKTATNRTIVSVER